MSCISDYSVDDLSDFLLEKGITGDVASTFTDNQIDGEAFLELTESDIKGIVKPLGVVKKLLRLQRECKPVEEIRSPSPQPSSNAISATIQSPSLFSSSPSPSQASTVSVANSGLSETTTSGVPLNFTIPKKWRPSIMSAIEEQKLTPDIRNEIVRDLVTHIYGYMEKPTTSFCKFVAQRLILQYQFMRDSMGTGYGTWEKKLTERVSNVHRKRKLEPNQEDYPPSKRGRPKKKALNIDDRYPALSQQGGSAEEERSSMEALRKEMKSTKPRRDIFLPLMKATFSLRRHYILHDAASVQNILQEYPALKRASTIEQEMELILSRPGVFNTFATEWQRKWVPAIMKYGSGLKKKDVVDFLSNHKCSASNISTGDEGEEKLAVGLLVLLFMPKKQSHDDMMKTVYEECLIGEDPEVVAAQPPIRNAPRFAEFEVEDGDSSYYIFIEQITLCETSTFTKALFLWFCTHYVFHLSYSPNLNDFATFFQEFIFGLPAKGKHSTSYLTTATDIQQLTVR